jgi:hypothetical protein
MFRKKRDSEMPERKVTLCGRSNYDRLEFIFAASRDVLACNGALVSVRRPNPSITVRVLVLCILLPRPPKAQTKSISSLHGDVDAEVNIK